ncbi:MAG: RNA polymerase sigma factor [Planctomycetota bacterium]|jgi:RNA polymerase sigma-70 factor (ECF subfamily)
MSIWTQIREITTDLGNDDPTAMTRLFDTSSPRLLRYAVTLTRNQADAEDAVQSALVRIARKPSLLAAADRPWAYLVRVVRNESLKIVEKRRPVLSLAKILHAWRPLNCPVEAEETRAQVQRAVRRLPAEQAEVIVLKIWEEFTFAEIAELVGESPNTVASRYRYALEKLERSLHGVATTLPRERHASVASPVSSARNSSQEVGHA